MKRVSEREGAFVVRQNNEKFTKYRRGIIGGRALNIDVIATNLQVTESVSISTSKFRSIFN